MDLASQLANYTTLCAQVDLFAQRVTAAFAGNMACRPGCDSCCRHLTLFPVEAYAVAVAVAKLSEAERDHLRDCARQSTPEACPLLLAGRCQLYAARPLICRTHGLPLLIAADDSPTIDFCPLNFHGVTNFSGSSVLNLQQLNTALTAINALFVREAANKALAERFTLAEALLLQI